MTQPAVSPFPVSTRDDVVLGGWLVRSVGTARAVVLVRTPYDARAHLPLATSLARHGFDCLVQDVRGRYSSAGAWRPYATEARDGTDTVDALHQRCPLTPVVAYGASYAAHTALETARTDPRVTRVVALVPALGAHETAYSADGTPQHLDRLGWWAIHGFAREDEAALAPDVLRTAAAVTDRDGPMAAAARLGWDGARLDAFRELWSAPALDVPDHFGDATAPLLVVTGDADPFDTYARGLAAGWGARSGVGSALVSGPWGHDLGIGTTDTALRAAYDAAGSPGRIILRWLTHAEPAPGQELRLDVAARTWSGRPLVTTVPATARGLR
ncbi:CocE/NonD family hydrolase [Nocardioides panzhihuensis]|uniref:Putative CocE/NonD family hydrolase n=1 Tax=Nocardioides panzhihuensis TaxID=860243 RepID=A0A7Z0DL33_9ACTN|nr:putative CocE/NonD family hydrolase [Nocardioides panzhihuensis]